MQRACLFICHDIEEFHSGSETRSEKADNHRHEATCDKSKTFIDKNGYFPLHLDMKVKSSSLSTQKTASAVSIQPLKHFSSQLGYGEV